MGCCRGCTNLVGAVTCRSWGVFVSVRGVVKDAGEWPCGSCTYVAGSFHLEMSYNSRMACLQMFAMHGTL